AERALRKLRATLSQEISDGKTTVSQCRKRLDAAETEVREFQRKKKVAGQSVRDIALSFGPNHTAWDNAIHGGKCSLILSLPWFILFLADFLYSDVNSSFLYPHLGFVTTVISFGLKWFAFGFFLVISFPT